MGTWEIVIEILQWQESFQWTIVNFWYWAICFSNYEMWDFCKNYKRIYSFQIDGCVLWESKEKPSKNVNAYRSRTTFYRILCLFTLDYGYKNDERKRAISLGLKINLLDLILNVLKISIWMNKCKRNLSLLGILQLSSSWWIVAISSHLIFQNQVGPLSSCKMCLTPPFNTWFWNITLELVRCLKLSSTLITACFTRSILSIFTRSSRLL